MPPIRQFRQQTGFTSQSPAVFDTGQTPTAFDVGASFFGQKFAEEQVEKRRDQEEEERRIKRARENAIRNSAINDLAEFTADFQTRVNDNKAKMEDYETQARKFISSKIGKIEDEALRTEANTLIDNAITKTQLEFQQQRYQQNLKFAENEANRLKANYKGQYVTAGTFAQRDRVFADFSELWLDSLRPFYSEEQEEELEKAVGFMRQEFELEALRVDAQANPNKAREDFEAGRYAIDTGEDLDTAESILRQEENRVRIEQERAERELRDAQFDSFYNRLSSGKFNHIDTQSLVQQLQNEGWQGREIVSAVGAHRGWVSMFERGLSVEREIGQKVLNNEPLTNKEADQWMTLLNQRNQQKVADSPGPFTDQFLETKSRENLQLVVTQGKSIPQSILNQFDSFLRIDDPNQNVTSDIQRTWELFQYLDNPTNFTQSALQKDLGGDYKELVMLKRQVEKFGNFQQGFAAFRKLRQPKSVEQIQAINNIQGTDGYELKLEQGLGSRGTSMEESPAFGGTFKAEMNQGLEIYENLDEAIEYANEATRHWVRTDYSRDDNLVSYPVEYWMQRPDFFGTTGGDDTMFRRAQKMFANDLFKEIMDNGYKQNSIDGEFIKVSDSNLIRGQFLRQPFRTPGLLPGGTLGQPAFDIADRVELQPIKETFSEDIEYFLFFRTGDVREPIYFKENGQIIRATIPLRGENGWLLNGEDNIKDRLNNNLQRGFPNARNTLDSPSDDG